MMVMQIYSCAIYSENCTLKEKKLFLLYDNFRGEVKNEKDYILHEYIDWNLRENKAIRMADQRLPVISVGGD